MNFILQFLVSIGASVCFAILFSVPKKELIFCGFTGALGWIIYYILVSLSLGVVLSSFVATFFLTVFARCFAVTRHTPVTVYLLTGIFPLVPGAGIFYTAYYLFTKDPSISPNKGIETFEIAGVIVLGIIFGFGIPQKLFNKLRNSRTL